MRWIRKMCTAIFTYTHSLISLSHSICECPVLCLRGQVASPRGMMGVWVPLSLAHWPPGPSSNNWSFISHNQFISAQPRAHWSSVTDTTRTADTHTHTHRPPLRLDNTISMDTVAECLNTKTLTSTEHGVYDWKQFEIMLSYGIPLFHFPVVLF